VTGMEPDVDTRLDRRLEVGGDNPDGRPAVAGRIPFGHGFTPVRSLLFPRLWPLIRPLPRWRPARPGPLPGC
jgi:hypothetical protein